MTLRYPIDTMECKHVAVATPRAKWRHIDTFSLDSDAIPAITAIPDLIFTEADAPKHPERFHAATVARAVWPLEPSMLGGLRFTLVGADNATANVLVGIWTPTLASLRGENPGVIQYAFTPRYLLALTAGTKTGVAGGIVNANDRYVDTVVVTTSYDFATETLRMTGPKDTSGVLVPDNTPVEVYPDMLGGSYGCVFAEGGTATGIKIFANEL